MTHWLVLSRSCQDCGGGGVMEVFTHEPTEEEVRATEREMGTCAATLILPLPPIGTRREVPSFDDARSMRRDRR